MLKKKFKKLESTFLFHIKHNHKFMFIVYFSWILNKFYPLLLLLSYLNFIFSIDIIKRINIK